MQESLLRGWCALGDLRDSRAVRAWFCKILRNERARLFERQLPDVCDPYLLPQSAARSYGTSAEAFVMRRLLTDLAPAQRDPLLLQVVGSFSCPETAELLGLNNSALPTRPFRARKILRERQEGSPIEEASQ